MNESLTPRDKAINHSLIPQAWEVYEYNGDIFAHKQDWIPWYKLDNHYAVCYQFKGQTAHYVICSHDAYITRQDALEWTKKHHVGKFRTITIDLSEINSPGKEKKK